MDDKNILELHVEQQDTDGTAKRAAEYHKRLIHQASILSEKEYQKFLLERLEKDNGFVVRKATNFDRYYAVDREMLFKFLNDTQSDTMEYLRKIYKDDLEETIVSFINAETTKTRGSLIEVLKHGIELSNQKIELMYTKPATTFNPELTKKYSQNIFSVMEEVWASDKERIDVVIFLNGLAIMAFELKCNAAGQSYQDAIYQFRTDRNPKTRLFRFKAGTLVNFAMDLEEVYMTTKLDGQATFFLPFNMGNGHGVTAGAGNPAFKDKYSVSYMWEDILTKDTILDLISKFIFVEVKEKVDEETGKVKRSENLIFPRYHQLDVIRKILADVRENGTAQNYLIQHSAGSGKTNSIAWLAHRLTSLHDAHNKIIFDNVVIVTDRVVVDRQLQKAIMGMEHKAGLIRVMDNKCVSADLAIALNGNTKIIATTIQKFPYIVDSVANLKNKRFAVIIDEAHSSTAGKDMAAITMTLGSGEDTEADVEDMISSEIKRNGKQANVSMFAFTATPKPTTIQLFGHQNTKGQKEAFHVYSMKQAIEEGFILDVLQNYTEYSTFYQINKEIEDDPRCKTNDAKRQIARFIELHDTNIAQRVEVIVEHFRTTVMQELGGQAKAMVITASRQSAVKYRQAFEDCGVVIKKEDDKLVIENPGSIRTGKKQMLRGGISDPRNKTLMKMFNMIGIGERAGSGIPDIYQVWENEGWPMPVVEESYNPDRTRLSLEFAKKQTIKTSEEEKEPKRSQKGAEKEPIKGAERKKEILKLIKVNSTITQVEIMKELDLTRKQVQKDMKELQEMHIIAREGTNRRGRWIIVKENK